MSNKDITKKLVLSFLFIILSLFLIFLVSASDPKLTAEKTVTPIDLNEGDTVTITFDLTGSGTPSIQYNDIDVVLTIDRSGSMQGQKLIDAKKAANTFVDIIDINYVQGGIVAFTYSPSKNMLRQQLTTNKVSMHSAINTLTASGKTAMGDGMNVANNELLTGKNARSGAIKVQVLMSDGQWNQGSKPIQRANKAAAKGIIIYTIGFGSDADEATLQEIADITHGKYYFAADGNDLQQIYEDIAKSINDLVASNVVINDVLPEGVEVDESSLPAGCSYDPTTRIVSCIVGLVNIGDNLPISFNVVVYDSDLTQVNAASSITYSDYLGDQQTITINPQPQVQIENLAPVINPILDKNVNELETLTFTVSAQDPGNDPIILTAENLPLGALFTDNGDGTGLFSWTPTATQNGEYIVTFHASDGQLSDSTTAKITVNDVAECSTNSDCSSLNNNYCDGTSVMHDEGVCGQDYVCYTQTTIVQECDDDLACNGQESCSEATCQAGTPMDCLEFNLAEIATCDNDPDKNPFTLDYAPAFISVCDEDTDSCTQGIQEITHTCDVANCQAECEFGNSQACTINSYAGTQTCADDCRWNTCQTTQSCGDGIINGNEVCDDGTSNGDGIEGHCNSDCSATTSSGGGGGGGTGGAACASNWVCDSWSACSMDGTQERTCRNLEPYCPGVVPAEQRSCTYIPPEERKPVLAGGTTPLTGSAINPVPEEKKPGIIGAVIGAVGVSGLIGIALFILLLLGLLTLLLLRKFLKGKKAPKIK